MKPASIITMIVAVLLIIAGFVTCLVAQNIAESEGEMLFAEDRDYGLVNTIDLAETAISKLELNVQDAKIQIHGQSETSYIELVNFRENYYSFSDSNRVVSFSEIPDVTSMLKFWENGVSFKGIRYLLTFREEEPEGEKVINIYLGGENIDLKIVSITGNNCEVTLDNLAYNTDYTFQLAQGDIRINNTRNASGLTVNGTDIAMDLQVSAFSNCNIQCSNLQFVGYRTTLPITTIDCATVDMMLRPNQSIGSLNFNIALDNGSVIVNENNLGNSFVQNISSNNRFELTAVSGSVTLKEPPSQAEITGGGSN
ncbi:MAG: hypothetical protein E7631_04710 [Ruminococcaceae bacterium]|nr:hypothetical protein [Oscillospiraceae bacterium]